MLKNVLIKQKQLNIIEINQFISVKVKKFYQKIFLLVKKHSHKLKNIIFLIK